MMSFQLHLIDTHTGGVTEIVLADPDREVLDRQMIRCVEYGGLELFAQWLSLALTSALPSVVDYDLRPPSDAQVKFAMAMARTLGVSLPSEVLRYRGAMHDFLSSHKDAFEARRRTRAPSASAPSGRDEGRAEAPE